MKHSRINTHTHKPSLPTNAQPVSILISSPNNPLDSNDRPTINRNTLNPKLMSEYSFEAWVLEILQIYLESRLRLSCCKEAILVQCMKSWELLESLKSWDKVGARWARRCCCWTWSVTWQSMWHHIFFFKRPSRRSARKPMSPVGWFSPEKSPARFDEIAEIDINLKVPQIRLNVPFHSKIGH